MDADSSYGGSDTAQDSTLGHDNNSLETTIPNHTESAHDHHDSSSHHDEVKSVNTPTDDDSNTYYKNEITLPVNYDETDSDKSSLPHYLSTAKLTIEESLENHHNLDELSKNYSSTHNLNAETPKPRKKSTSGIDNPAYQEDETKPPTTNGALKSTFDEKKTYNNGDLNSSASLGFTSPTKNDEPMSEAVNLELINLKPTGKDVVGPYENGNGISDIPVKKETEVEIGNPYDEYFVPVNEHRKYMRGEKLYLTKDKRDTKKRNRCLCWSLLLAIVVAAVIVGILAAVGIIGNQEPEPIQEARNFGGSSSPNDIKTGGGFFGISEEGESATKTPSRTGGYPITPEPPLITVSSLLPTTDTSMIEVPRALESQFKIDNLDFSEELMNPNSTEYKNLAETIENQLKEALFTNDVMNYGPANIQLKVVEFMPGSVVVKYRIGWEFKEGIHNPQDPIDLDALRNKFHSTLTRTDNYLDNYHVQEDSINAGKVMNLCQIDKNGCEHACAFDYKQVNFVCTCPSHQHLDMDGKKCIDEPHPEPEPATEPDVVDFEFENVHTSPKPEPSPEPSAVPEPEPAAEPTAVPEPEPTAQPEPKPEPEATPEPVANPEPTAHPEPEPTAHPEPEPTAHPEPEPTVLPEPEPTAHPEPEPTAHLEPEPTSHPEPEPTAQPEPEPTAQPEPEPEPTVQPEPQPEPQPTAEPTPEPEPKSQTEPVTKSQSYTTNNLDHQSVVHNYMTTSEPTNSSGREGKLDDGYMENIPIAEPTPEPVPVTEPVPTTEPVAEPTVKPEPTTQAQPETEMEHTARTELVVEVHQTPAPIPNSQWMVPTEPSTESEPAAEPEPTPEPEVKPETTVEPKPATEPAVEPEPTTALKPMEPSSSTEQNLSAENETNNGQSNEGHRFIVQSAEKHTTTIPETTTMNQELFVNAGPKIQEITFNDSNIISTDNAKESESATKSVNVGTEVFVPEKTTFKSEVEQLTSGSLAENPTTTIPEQSTHEKLQVNVAVPIEESTTVNVINPPNNDSTIQQSVSNSSEEMATINPVIIPIEGTTMETEEQTVLVQQLGSEQNNTSIENTIEPITTVATVNKTESDVSTNSSEQTTQTAEKQSNWIPVELNSKNEMINIDATTPVNTNESVINQNVIPVVINSETHLIDMGNSTLVPGNTSQKEFETTTLQQTTPEIANTSSENQNIIYIQDHITENTVSHTTTPEIHPHMVTYDPTESTNNLDNMSPFLPEIENDTLVKILHSDVDHHTDMPFHHQNDSDMHDEHVFTEKPPRLDNDEMNVTNPRDPNPTDTALGVTPSEEDKTEKLNEILSSLEVTTQKESSVAQNELTGKQVSESTDNATEMVTMAQEVPSTTVVMETVSPMKAGDENSQINIATTRSTEFMTTSPRNIEPTLNPDILNNVHSNNFFFKLHTSTESAEGHTEVPLTTTKQPEQNSSSTEMNKAQENITASHENFTDINTSTEDLVALETTTNKLGEVKETTTNNLKDINESVTQVLTTEASNSKRNASTIFADIVDIATEIVHFKSENNTSTEITLRPETVTIAENKISFETTLRPEMVNNTENSNPFITTTLRTETVVNNTESNNSVGITVQPETGNNTENNSTTVTASQNVLIETTTEIGNQTERTPQYEVHENLSEDVTTTVRNNILKLTPTKTLIENEEKTENKSQDPLSIIQLPEEDLFAKQDKKRANENFNKFDPIDSLYDPNDFLNDISDEEKSVLDKFVDVDHISSKQKESEKLIPKSTSETKVDYEHEKDHYLATDFTDKATFTATPSKTNYFDNSEKESYSKLYFPERTISETEEIVTENKNTTESISSVKPVTEGFTISGFSRCAAGQFQCRNGTAVKDGSYCIPSNDQCDSTDDCTDASDEAGCAQEKCRDNFQCASGQCLKRNLVCDGIANCNDRSDEQNCESWKCRFDEFSCGDGGRCIPLSWKCDGHAHCPNAEDEYHCNAETCNNNAYHCVEQGACIRSSLRCDGKQDCAGGDDENLCECAVDQFKCKIGGGCIPLEQQCDGIEQCPDFSDEWNCLRLQESNENVTTSSYLEVLSTNQTWLQICSDSWNNSYSDLACQSLGYAGATSTESSKMLENSTNSGFYKLKSLQQYGAHLLTQLEKTESCDYVVEVTCQEFVCGSHTSLDTQSARIIGGSSAAETQWPSVTLLYNKKYNRQCTATLIAPLWVIASYSCVLASDTSSSSSSNEWILYAGGTNFFNNVDNSTMQVRPVKNIIIHPQEKYSQFVFKHDMVLVELASPLMLRQNVAAICLPQKDIEPRQLCVTAGWGISRPGDSNTQQYLHYLPVPTIDMEECNSTKHYNGRVPDDKICAGYTDSDKTPCYNDEGAPLMCFSDSAGTWELHGLLAYHSNCGRNHHPALYSSINEDSRQWIANTIGLKAVTNQRLALNKE